MTKCVSVLSLLISEVIIKETHCIILSDKMLKKRWSFLQHKLVDEFILLRFDFGESFIFNSVPVKNGNRWFKQGSLACTKPQLGTPGYYIWWQEQGKTIKHMSVNLSSCILFSAIRACSCCCWASRCFATDFSRFLAPIACQMIHNTST